MKLLDWTLRVSKYALNHTQQALRLCLIVIAAFLATYTNVLYAADDSKQHIVIVAGAHEGGVGNQTYGYKTFNHLKKTMPEHDYTLILYGSANDYTKCKTIFNLDIDNNPEHMWIPLEKNEKDIGLVSQANAETFKTQIHQRMVGKPTPKVVYMSLTEFSYDEDDNILGLLRATELTPDVLMNIMYYEEPSLSQGMISLRETLHGLEMGGLATDASQAEDFADEYWLTREADDEGDGEDDPYPNMDTFAIEARLYFPELQDLELHEFGFGRRSLGLMLSNKIADTAKQLTSETPSVRDRALRNVQFTNKDQPWLTRLTGTSSRQQQLDWLAEQGDFHFAYMHNAFSLLEFMATMTFVTPDNPTFVVNLPANVITEEGPVNELLKDLASKHGLGTISYWSHKSGDITVNIDTDLSGTLRIINPFSLNKETMEAMITLSRHGVVGCTGDHSLYDVISAGKVPFHENVPHLFGLHEDLAYFAEQQELTSVSVFLETPRADIKSELIRGQQLQEEWQIFKEYLWNNHNSYPKLEEIFARLLAK